MFNINVISGLIKGLKLESDKNEKLRPTKERIKESLFDILGSEIIDKNFLDLFGGTGQIGIEAFSRGAKEVLIVELQKSNTKIIKKNISKIKVDNNIKLFNEDALDFLNNHLTNIDIVFIDPPYNEEDLLQKSLEKVAEKINENGIIITETLYSHNAQKNIKNFSLKRRYKYGIISLNVYKRD